MDVIYTLINGIENGKRGWVNEGRREEADQSIENRSSGNRVNCNPLNQRGFDDVRASNPS